MILFLLLMTYGLLLILLWLCLRFLSRIDLRFSGFLHCYVTIPLLMEINCLHVIMHGVAVLKLDIMALLVLIFKRMASILVFLLMILIVWLILLAKPEFNLLIPNKFRGFF